MAVEDAERWDRRHADAGPAVAAPPDALVASGLADEVPVAGRALDVACGAGAQAVWLATRGLDVVAVDASAVAIDLVRRAADAAGVAPRVDARVVDLDHGVPVELRAFDVVVCQRFRAVHLYDCFVERLRPGGLAVVTVLSSTGATSPGPFHAPSGELRSAFLRPDAELLFHHEADGQESVVVRRPPRP